MKRLLVLLLIVVFFVPVALATSRTWKSSNGRFSTEAELLGFKDGKVQLKKADGKVIAVPLHSLSAADQRYIKKRYPAASAPGGVEKKKKAKAAPPEDDEEEAEPVDESGTTEDVVQDIAMTLLRLDPPKRKSRSKSLSLAAYVLRLTKPQRFVQKDKGGGSKEAEFHRLVKKEPKYVAPIPFRGVVKLGGRSFGFALDAVAPKSNGYDRLYFDANGNGDLTDDPTASASDVAKLGSNMSQSQFPRVSVNLDAGGGPAEYAFLLSALCRQSNGSFYATVSLYSAVARAGYLTQGKKRTRVLLVDSNSNGRFDDVISVRPNGNLAEGDMLLINPNPKKKLAANGEGTDWNMVGKVICIGKRFHRMIVTPDGGKLQLTPMQLSLGNVICSSHTYRSVLSSDDYGVVVIFGAKDQKCALMEGTWKVINYTLDATIGNGSRRTAVEATFGNSPPLVTVKKGETAILPFGGPFRAVVTASKTKKSKVSLHLRIVGPSGEQCRSIRINGRRPPKPHFIIKDKNDKIVHQGDFEYG